MGAIMNGRVEVIVGGMYGGKSEELIRRLRRAVIAKQSVVCFKPAIDTRYHETDVASHAGAAFPAIPVSDIHTMYATATAANAVVVGIDEVQFFDEGIVDVVRSLAGAGIRVVVAGLDLDYRGIPFGPVPHLLAEAEDIMKVHAVCTVCGRDASRSQRLTRESQTVLVGGAEAYEARCRAHWTPHPVVTPVPAGIPTPDGGSTLDVFEG